MERAMDEGGDAWSSGDTVDTSPGWEVRGDAQRVAPGAAALFLVLESRQPLEPGCRVMLDAVDEVIVARGAATHPGQQIERVGRAARLLVADLEMSRRHLAIRRGADGWELEDLGSRNGTFVGGRRVQSARLEDGDVIAAGGSLLMFRAALAVGTDVVPGDTCERGDRAFATLSLELAQRFAQVARIAPSRVPVLVRGETGSGKEVLARAIHDASGRTGAFVAVNCGALPTNLIESELFGHRRGAFSGAHEERDGLVRRANGGTLFLDEIAELPEESQVALLRVLQEGEVRPVGASDPVKVDIRVVAATHQDIPARIADGRFRQDLYARLAGFEMVLPALRDRREDLGTLIAAILPRVCPNPGRITLHRAAARALLRYPWPLNVRELEQALRAAVALTDTGELRFDHLPEVIRTYAPPSVSSLRPEDRVLRERVIELLREHTGNVTAVGRAMGKAPIQIRRWCHRLQIELSQFRS
jgi:transcriptional regulator of acetoin/glycerol metabolism